MSKQKKKGGAAALSSDTDCLVSLMRYLTNQAVKMALFPSSGIEDCVHRKAVPVSGRVTSPCQSGQLDLPKGNLQGH